MSFITQLASLPLHQTKDAEEQSLEHIFQTAITNGDCRYKPEEFWNAFWKEFKLKAPPHRFEELSASLLSRVLSEPEHRLNCLSSFLTIGNKENFFQSWCEEIPVVREAFWNREWHTLISYLQLNNYSLSSPELQCLFIAEIESNNLLSLDQGDCLTALKACHCWGLLQFSARDASILVGLLQYPQQVSRCQAIGEGFFAQKYGILFHYLCLSKGILSLEGGYQFLLTTDYIRYFTNELHLAQNPTSINSFSSSSSEEIPYYRSPNWISESLPLSSPQPTFAHSYETPSSHSFSSPSPFEEVVSPPQFSTHLQPTSTPVRQVIVIEDEEVTPLVRSSQQKLPLPSTPSQQRHAASHAPKIRLTPKITHRPQAVVPISNGAAGTTPATSEFNRIAELHKSRNLDIQTPEEAAAKLMTVHKNGGFAYEWVDAYVLLREEFINSKMIEIKHFEMLVTKLEIFWTSYFNLMITEFNTNQELLLWEIPFNSFHDIKSPTAYLTFFKIFTQFLPSFRDFEQIYGMALSSIQRENKLDSILYTMSEAGFRPLTCELCHQLLSTKADLLQSPSNYSLNAASQLQSAIETGGIDQTFFLTSTNGDYPLNPPSELDSEIEVVNSIPAFISANDNYQPNPASESAPVDQFLNFTSTEDDDDGF